MIRLDYFNKIARHFTVNPVVALLGPRQCGKTTLARDFVAANHHVFAETHFLDLEDPVVRQRLTENPKLSLETLRGLVVLDEIQRVPDLFSVLRVLVDRPNVNCQFLILGSASRDLIRQSSESLAGRLSYLEVTPFALTETGIDTQQTLWLRGGFPRSFLAENDDVSRIWRENYIRTFLERDIPQLGIKIPAESIRRFWLMLAHYHGQIVNYSELGKSLDLADTTIRRYLDILTGTFMVRTLTPWFENIGKRQVKQPKIYFRDSGIFHRLLGVTTMSELNTHPKLGASWEGFAHEEITRHHASRIEDCYFWAVHAQMELDLMILKNGKRIGFEIKYSQTPQIKAQHHEMIKLLHLDELIFVAPIENDFRAGDKIRVCGLRQALDGQRQD